MNKKYISVLFILIFYACEFKILEDLDPPNWYWDLSVPLIDNEYSFEGILQEGVLTTTAEQFTDSNGNGVWDNGDCDNSSYTNECDCEYAGEIWNPGETFIDENNNCIWDDFGLSDSLHNMIQMEFVDDLEKIGLSVVEQDLGMSFFNLDLSDVSIDDQVLAQETTTDLGENLPSNPLINISEPISIPDIDNPLICDNFLPDNSQTLLGQSLVDIAPSPSDIIELIPDIPPQSIDLDFGDVGTVDLGDMGSFTIEKIIFANDMDWSLSFRNALPFPVESLSFDIYIGDFTSGDIPLGTPKFCSLIMEDINPYETRNNSMIFTGNPPELPFNTSLTIDVNIEVNENPSTLNDCDLDLCVADAISSDGNFDFNNISECSIACDPCLEQGIFVCTNGGAVYDSQIDCESACSPFPCVEQSVFLCATEIALTGNATPYSTEGECNTSCDQCIQENLVGWNAQDDNTIIELNTDIRIDAIVVDLDTNQEDQYCCSGTSEFCDPLNNACGAGIDCELCSISLDFPEFDQVDVQQAIIGDGTDIDDDGTTYTNEITLTFNNGFFSSGVLELTFANIFNDENSIGNPYSETINVEANSTSSETFNLSDKVIGDGNTFEDLIINYNFSFEANNELTIPLENNILTIRETSYSADVDNIKLESLSAITQDLSFPQVQSTPIQDIPSGFDDFQLYDIFLEMNIYNEITINTLDANFTLEGKRCSDEAILAGTCFADSNTSPSTIFPFKIALDSSNRLPDNPCGFSVGDIATTKVLINKERQLTNYYCSEQDDTPYQVVECFFTDEDASSQECPDDFGESSSLLDFIYSGPNMMNLDGAVTIDGEGTLRENDNLWGDFSVKAPLAFIFTEDWVFIPQDITTINATDENTSNQIDSSLVEALFHSSLNNHSPFGISMSMLASDNTIFPVYLDYLSDYYLDVLATHCTDEITADSDTCLCGEGGVWDSANEECTVGDETGFSWVNYQDSLTELGVSDVNFTSLATIDSPDDNRAKYVEFLDVINEETGEAPVLFWVGRVMDVSFIPPSELDENGFVIEGGDTSVVEELDRERISWITAPEERYMVPMIKLASTGGQPAATQTSNFIGVKSFLTFTLDTEGLSSVKDDKVITNEQNSPNASQ